MNYRGDAPLLIFHTNGNKHILQIDGDLFFPLEVDLADLENEDEIYDAYLFEMDEALRMLNILLYEDMELETDLEEDEIADFEPYYIGYDGEQEDAFNKILLKIKNEDIITNEDIISLN